MLWVMFVQLAGWSAISCSKTFSTGHYTQTVQPNCVIPAMLIGTTDFYHFIPLSLTLTLPGDYKISAKQSLLASFFHTFCIWSGWNLMWWWSSSSWASCDFWLRFTETRGITAVFADYIKSCTVGIHADVYKSVWIQLGTMNINDRYYCTVHFYTSLGRNNLLALCWAHCHCVMQHHGFDPPLRKSFSVEGILPLELTWVLTPFPKTLLDESINRGLVCAHTHTHSITQTQKIPTLMS